MNDDNSYQSLTVLSYEFDVEKMSPFTGKELPPEAMVKETKRE
jgi:hypothetical protein